MTRDQRTAIVALLTRFHAESIDVEDDGTVIIDGRRLTNDLPYQLVVDIHGDATVTCRL